MCEPGKKERSRAGPLTLEAGGSGDKKKKKPRKEEVSQSRRKEVG